MSMARLIMVHNHDFLVHGISPHEKPINISLNCKSPSQTKTSLKISPFKEGFGILNF